MTRQKLQYLHPGHIDLMLLLQRLNTQMGDMHSCRRWIFICIWKMAIYLSLKRPRYMSCVNVRVQIWRQRWHC